jgi:threonyl-tRNA synthetase
MAVVGDREQAGGQVSVREHRAGDTGSASLDDFAGRVKTLVKSRSMG